MDWSFIRKLDNDIKIVFWIGVALFVLGIIYAIFSIFFSQWRMSPTDFISIGMSFVGFAIAFVALKIAVITDDSVRSLTYLSFDEKRAILSSYLNLLSREHYHDADFKNNLLRFESDILAVSRLKDHIREEDIQLFLQFINPHIKSLSDNQEIFEDVTIKTAINSIVNRNNEIASNMRHPGDLNQTESSQQIIITENEQLTILNKILISLNKANINTERYTKGIAFLSFIATMVAIESFLFSWMQFNNETTDLAAKNNLAQVGIGLMLLNAVTIAIFWGYFLIPRHSGA